MQQNGGGQWKNRVGRKLEERTRKHLLSGKGRESRAGVGKGGRPEG